MLKHNLRSRSIEGWAKELNANEALRVHRRKDNILLYHTILSFSDKDKEHITPSLLKDISKKFVEFRGKDNIYLAAAHHDKDHVHLHIIMSGTKYMTGESNRISKKEFHELKLAMDTYQKQKYPMLNNSLPDHGKSSPKILTEKEHQLQTRGGKLSQKQQVVQAVETLYNQSRSLDHFLFQLQSEGYEPYSRGGKLYGVEKNDRRYRFKTIGYDGTRLDELDRQRDDEERELQELCDLRESRSTEKEMGDERTHDDESSDQAAEDEGSDLEYDDQGL